MNDAPTWLQPCSHGIDVIDTGFQRPGFDAAYLIVEEGKAAFIDTGTNHSVPRLLEALTFRGLTPDAVEWVIATHVHLDHAGGVGQLMKRLPQAKLAVHPRGAPHMIDPGKLVLGAQAVYGVDAVERDYGDVIGVPADRVVNTSDCMTIKLGWRKLLILETPGHAKHHQSIWDERSEGIFTGDSFGLSYRELDTPEGPYILPSSTPVHFDPDAMRESIFRMLGLGPMSVYLTHYGALQGVPRLGNMLLAQVDRMVEAANQVASQGLQGPGRHAALIDALGSVYASELAAIGTTLSDEEIRDYLSIDIELNAQGLGVWLDQQNRS